jgi:3-oxoacyl-[acyl-carrier-protein] synthase I
MVTALGFNAPATLAALRAGISAVGETAWVDDDSGEPLRGAKVALPQWWEGVGKLAELLAPAVDESLLGVDKRARADIPILIGVAAHDRAERIARLDEDLLDELHVRLEQPVHPNSKLFAGDQAGCAEALVAARKLLDEGRVKQVVVAGVDSFLHQPTLDAYIERRRVITPNNSNGFFPGEAACAVLVGAAGANGDEELLIRGQGLAHEPSTIDSTDPLRARGLTEAVRAALQAAGVKLKDIAYRLTDLSGEHYKFKEALFAAGRLNSVDSEYALELWHPIEFLGEIGAAILPCLLAQAMHAAQEAYAPGPLALCHVGSDGGARAAFVVGLTEGGRRSVR